MASYACECHHWWWTKMLNTISIFFPVISDFDLLLHSTTQAQINENTFPGKFTLTFVLLQQLYIAHSSLYAFDKWQWRLNFKMDTLFNSLATLSQILNFIRPAKHPTIRIITTPRPLVVDIYSQIAMTVLNFMQGKGWQNLLVSSPF